MLDGDYRIPRKRFLLVAEPLHEPGSIHLRKHHAEQLSECEFVHELVYEFVHETVHEFVHETVHEFVHGFAHETVHEFVHETKNTHLQARGNECSVTLGSALWFRV